MSEVTIHVTTTTVLHHADSYFLQYAHMCTTWPFKHKDTDKVCNSTFLQRQCENLSSHNHRHDHAKVNDNTQQSQSSSKLCDFSKVAVFCPQHRHMPENIIRWTNQEAMWVQEGCALFAEQSQHRSLCLYPQKGFAATSTSCSGQNNCVTSFTSSCAHMTRNIAPDTVQRYCRRDLHDLTVSKAGLRCCRCVNFAQYGSE